MPSNNRSGGRDVHIFSSSDRSTLLGGLILTIGITNSNLYTMVEKFVIIKDEFVLRNEKSINVNNEVLRGWSLSCLVAWRLNLICFRRSSNRKAWLIRSQAQAQAQAQAQSQISWSPIWSRFLTARFDELAGCAWFHAPGESLGAAALRNGRQRWISLHSFDCVEHFFITGSSNTPNKGAVVIHGVLYTPYPKAPSLPADQLSVDSLSTTQQQSTVPQPPPAFAQEPSSTFVEPSRAFTPKPAPTFLQRPALTITEPPRTFTSKPISAFVQQSPQTTTRQVYTRKDSSTLAQHSQTSTPLPPPTFQIRKISKNKQSPKMSSGPNDKGALGATFTVVRAMQFICIISIIGMTSNFIAQMIKVDQSPPAVLIGTLSVVCIAVLYIILTYILYWDNQLPFLISTGVDFLLLIAVIVIAVTVGKPLSYLNCAALPNDGTTSTFLDSVGLNMGKVNYWVWVGASKTTCFEMKAIWGLSIALCILFASSAVVMGCLWRRGRMGFVKQVDNA
ncbi:hypothetical protein B7494_g4204 [Chlorociboria aeruginascens]|nr:hypothetical protein B7494_g4204 [Chlorociboria aeruginascens]